jgi:hypothetical protein
MVIPRKWRPILWPFSKTDHREFKRITDIKCDPRRPRAKFYKRPESFLIVLARVFPALCLRDIYHICKVMRLLVCRYRIHEWRRS